MLYRYPLKTSIQKFADNISEGKFRTIDQYIGSFSNMPALILYIITGFIIMTRAVNRQKRNDNKQSHAKIFLYRVGYLLFVIAAYQLCLGDFNRPSTVDITPLYNIIAMPFYNKETLNIIVDSLRNYENFYFVFQDDDINGELGYAHVSYSMRCNVNISVYDSILNACEWFDFEKKDFDGKRRYIKITDDIEVILGHSKMERLADVFYAYSNLRNITTFIRIGNILFKIKDYRATPPNVEENTNMNISLICSILGDISTGVYNGNKKVTATS